MNATQPNELYNHRAALCRLAPMDPFKERNDDQ